MTTETPPLHPEPNNSAYTRLLQTIGQTLQSGRVRAYRVAEQISVQTRWEIGRHIVEYEQHGQQKSEYGSYLLDRLAQDLTTNFGKGFSRSNIVYIRKLYLTYPIGQMLSDQLSWSHYCELLVIEDDLERSFYERQSVLEKWSIKELQRQKKSALFLRLAHSRDKEGILKLAREGQQPESPEAILRDPLVLEFLQIPEKHHYTEQELERQIVERLQYFLLELGKGFTFVGRQYRISFGDSITEWIWCFTIEFCAVLCCLISKSTKSNMETSGK